MKLTIAGKPVAIPVDTKISLQRSSPALNEDTGSFSYPFSIPRLPNQHVIGWPGKLQRIGAIADQTFILEDNGLQIFEGEVDYDTVTKDQIGVILKSGYTVFRGKMEGKKLTDIDYGFESWLPEYFTDEELTAKMAEWDAANTVSNDKYVVSPCHINGGLPSGTNVNYVLKSTGNLINGQIYCLQFRAYFMLEKIFESLGYTILVDELKTSEFKDLVIFSRIMRGAGYEGHYTWCIPGLEPGFLHYAKLMPNVLVLDFVDEITKLLCMVCDVDERMKTVRIIFKKNIFVPGNIDPLKMVELVGWEHSEKQNTKGFSIGYKSQTESLDIESGYIPDAEVATTLPVATKEGAVIHVVSLGYDYVTENNSDVLEWKQIGRLKDYTSGTDPEKIEFAFKVPVGIIDGEGDGTRYISPHLDISLPMLTDTNNGMNELMISLYHGRKSNIPFLSGVHWEITEVWTIELPVYLTPAYLLPLHTDFLNWKAYQARAFTKYIQLTLPEVLSLRWDKKYVIDGIEVILDKINFELPHKGTVKIEGFTA